MSLTLEKNKISQVVKRNGNNSNYDKSKIVNAVYKAMEASGEKNPKQGALLIADKVEKELHKRFSGKTPRVEDIQDLVEETLVMLDYYKTVKAYILYRKDREIVRLKSEDIPEEVKKLVEENSKYFQNNFGEFIFYRSYSRWCEEKGRREVWSETVDRYISFMKENLGKKLSEEEYKEIKESILNQETMPSMRLMWSAGEAAKKNPMCVYNCSFIAPMELKDFSDIMFILMSGTGVGYTVEDSVVQELPIIKKQIGEKLNDYVVEDSREGWADALLFGLETWYSGKDVSFNYKKIRPFGSRLKTMGGRASGHESLKSLLDFCREKILSRQGKRLSSLDTHDLVCKIAEVVVAGGTRRSSLISLSDLDNLEMRHAKDGQFYLKHPFRSMANNSATYNEKPTVTQFLDEWISLAKSGSGERGIFNRYGLKFQMPQRRWKTFRKYLSTSGTNPCGEIILRSYGLCNLTEVVARISDNLESLLRKIRIATILGTYQAMLTNFKYVSEEWKRNAEEERLLGVSVTGQWDCIFLRDSSPEILIKLKEEAIKINEEYSKRFGIEPSLCITTTKPSGTVSSLVNASSGSHPRYAKYYVRRVRISASDPLFKMLKDQKYPYSPEVGQDINFATTYVLEFPIKSPEMAITRNDLRAIDQLEHWKNWKINYTEHNVSKTVEVLPDEWLEVADWVYKNFDIIGGLSFLPKNGHVYQLAPFEEISEEEYNKKVSQVPKIDFSKLILYEREDLTEGFKELACSSGSCEI